MARSRELRLGLLGLGTVGSGLVELLERDAALLRRRLGRPVRITRVAVRHPRRRRALPKGIGRLTADPFAVVTDPDVDVVVELIGGVRPARRLVLTALEAGKDVVTANKALLAMHGAEIFSAAEAHGAHLGFEASVAGGVPIIRTLRDSLSGDRIRAIYGIVNGTCNWILTAMTDRGVEFREALREAQELGLAEADPTLDVEGIDAAQKLSILAMLAFGALCPADRIHAEGIRHVSQIDVSFATELGYVIKLLAVAIDDGRTIDARVHPAMIPARHLLADVRDATNAIYVDGEALGPSMSVGQGAGRLPTATAVLADIVAIGRERQAGPGASPPLGTPWKKLGRRRMRAAKDLESEYYLRFMVLDRPGVLGRIAGRLGAHRISIASVIQKERRAGDLVPIVIRTHDAKEGNLRRALGEIVRLGVVHRAPAVVRVIDRL